MFWKHAGVIALATASALAAGGGVVAFGRAGPHVSVAPSPATAPATAPPGEGRAPKGTDGHYWATAEVDGAPIRFLVDTGASVVALTPRDARRLGLILSRLDYSRPVITADGATHAAPVTLDHIAVGGARVAGVQALVLADDAPASLLGMSYLGRLTRFAATRDALVLSR